MPRADYEALEARHHARRNRGDDSDDSTVANDDNDQDDPDHEVPIEVTFDAPRPPCFSVSSCLIKALRNLSTMTR